MVHSAPIAYLGGHQLKSLALHELEHVEEAVVAAGCQALLQPQHLNEVRLKQQERKVLVSFICVERCKNARNEGLGDGSVQDCTACVRSLPFFRVI